MFVHPDHHKHYITKEDLLGRCDDKPVRWLGPALKTDDQVLRGAIGFVQIEEGLSVHYSNAEDLHDLKIESDCGPRLSVCLFLEGTVEASVGEFEFPMPEFDPVAGSWSPIAVAFSQGEKEKFIRRASRGVRLKKVTVSLSPEWLSGHIWPTDSVYEALQTFLAIHLNSVSWTPSVHAVGLAEQIIAAPQKSEFQHRLYIASRVYGLLEEAFQYCSGQQEAPGSNLIAASERKKLQAIEQYLRQQAGHLATADELAHGTGMSLNSLQRLLTRTYGLSTSRFIRRFMLERAREALERDSLTIAEAAHIAGYSSPANFATAFKREFGLSPRQVT